MEFKKVGLRLTCRLCGKVARMSLEEPAPPIAEQTAFLDSWGECLSVIYKGGEVEKERCCPECRARANEKVQKYPAGFKVQDLAAEFGDLRRH
jgi:hypothetical protein